MLAAARSLFEGRVSAQGGRGTASEHYTRFAKAGVKGYVLEPEAKPDDEAPEEFAHLIVWYLDIRSRAHRGQMFEPINYQDMEAYERMLLRRAGLEMEAIDVELLCRIDNVWQDVQPKPEASAAPLGDKGGKRPATRH